MVMEEINVAEARKIAKKKGLKPGRVRTTKSGVQFTEGKNYNVEVISWEQFEKDLKKRGLRIYNSNGWMKIKKK